MPNVDVIRIPGNDEPRIIVQLREDEPSWSMTVQEAWAYVEENLSMICGDGKCVVCHIIEALHLLR